jgi:hypothetical protein
VRTERQIAEPRSVFKAGEATPPFPSGHNSHRVRKAALMLGSVFFFGMAAFSVFFGVLDRREAEDSKQWPSVQGAITSIDLRRFQNVGRASRFVKSQSYTIEVQYSYAVGGQQFQGHRISLGDLPMDERDARAMSQRYPVGSTPLVYYDPSNPAKSVLEPGFGGTTDRHVNLFAIVMPAGFFFVGAAMLAGVIFMPFLEHRAEVYERARAQRI